MGRIKIGIIGCGTIGSEIARACQERLSGQFSLVAICDADSAKAAVLQRSLNVNADILPLDDLIKKVDLVVEAASARISASILEKAILSKRDILIMSIGGLIGREKLLQEAGERGVHVYLPSGALCGLDGLKGSSIGRIDLVTLTTRKPPKGLEGAPYVVEHNINLSSITGETTIFEGNAEEAVKGFPANVNVCAVLSLAGIGAKKTRVRIVTSPDYTKNIHEVEITGESGTIRTRTENLPSKTNPKTSQLAVYSAIATLEGIVRTVRIGT